MSWEDNVRRVTPYTPGEQPKKEHVIKLNTNENPYPPSPKVEQAWKQFNTDALRLYPDPSAGELVQALADIYSLRPENIFVGVGSDDVLAMIYLTFFNSGRPILFPDITYSFYDVWAEEFRIPYEVQPLDETFQIRIEDYQKENGGVIFPNPNAPTGVLMPLQQAEEIIAMNRDVVVVVDEAYIDFGGQSVLPLIEKYDNLVVVQTFSKSRSMAGMRIGYAMAQPRLIAYLNDVKYSFNSYTMNKAALTLGTAAALDSAYFEQTRNKIIATRERAKKEFAALGFVFGDSKSNFLFVTHPRAGAQQLAAALREQDIYVRHFKKPERISNYLRITIGTDEQMDALFAFLREYLQNI